MIAFPNCKINLGLHVTQKRQDNFHDIETVFFPLPFKDIIEIVSAKSTTLSNTGIPVETDDRNLCMKAYFLLKKDFPQLPPVHIHLHKAIPVGAGLGGGSADAAYMLELINKKFSLQISGNTLFEYALQLGSDCPFFILNQPAYATGRGDILKEIGLSLKKYKILLVNPGIHINTREAFAGIKPAPVSKKIEKIILSPIETWKNELRNDFEKIVFEKYPLIKKIKEDMYTQGAIYASMTGTGSTVYGIFNLSQKLTYPDKNEYFHKWITLV